MRLLILSLILANAALMADADPGSAQSPTSYPWCSKGSVVGARSCYYSNFEQCMVTVSGIGRYCFQSPYYRERPDNARRRY